MRRTVLGVLWDRQVAAVAGGGDTFVRGESGTPAPRDPQGPPPQPRNPSTAVRAEAATSVERVTEARGESPSSTSPQRPTAPSRAPKSAEPLTKVRGESPRALEPETRVRGEGTG